MKQTILCITPHLSTGGCPQFLVKKLENLTNYNIIVIEYSNVSDEYIVQKNKIKKLNFPLLFTLEPNSKLNQIKNIIKKYKPDIIHFEEMPEYFMENSVADWIYNKNNKNYLIFETSHDSSFNIKNKKYLPDKFVFVSKYQVEEFKPLGVPIELLEYSFEIQKKDKEKALLNLNLTNEKFHIINIGLFTSRKNQGEIIELARQLKDKNILFHFVGNRAPNFEFYWGPITKNLPENCILWGEREDIENFYQIADLFYFASKGTNGDKETSPLVIRESINYNVPILIRNLDTYNNMYQNFNNVFYLDKNDLDINKNQILFFYQQWLNKKVYKKEESNQEIKLENLRFDTVENKIKYGWKPESIFNVRVTIRDMVNKLVIFSYVGNLIQNEDYWVVPIGNTKFAELPNFKGFLIEIRNSNNELIEQKELIINHGAKIIDDFEFKVDTFDPTWYNYCEFFFKHKYKELENKIFDTVIDIGANCGTFTRFAQKEFKAKKIYSVEPNKKAFKHLYDSFKNEKNVFLINKGIGKTEETKELYSCNENTTICSLLPEQIDKFFKLFGNTYTTEVIDLIPFEKLINENNIEKIDLLKIDVEGFEYEIMENISDNIYKKINNIILELHYTDKFRDKVSKLLLKLIENNFDISYYDNNGKLTNDIYSVPEGMGVIICVKKKKTNLNLKAVHILTLPDTEREKKSIDSISQLKDLDIKYVQMVNEPYKNLPPKENCARPQDISLEPGDMKLSPGHYGCYLGHKKAILEGWEKDLDGLLIFECDSVLLEDKEKFIQYINNVYNDIEKYKLRFFSFGPIYMNEGIIDMGTYYITPKLFEMHAYLITKSNYNYVKSKLENSPWDVFDLFVSTQFEGEKFGNIKEHMFMQAKGYSLLDKKISTHNWHGQEKI